MGIRGKTWLIFNGASGSHDDATIEALAKALDSAGHSPTRLIDCKDGTPKAQEAEAAGVGLLVIHGGDGTISRTLADYEGFPGAILPLPGGTLNLLAREIFGERDPLAIARLLGERRLAVRRRNCIRGDGVLAVVELLAGPGAKWADVREELREANLGEAIARSWNAAAESAVGPMVALSQPAVGREEGYAGIRLRPLSEGIAIEGFGAEGLGDYVQHGIAILKRDFREGPHDDLGLARRIVCQSLEDRPVPLMIDGERSEGAATLRFTLDTLEVDLLGIADDR